MSILHRKSFFRSLRAELISTKDFLVIIGIMVRVFANGLGDQGSIPDRVIPKTQKMVPDAALLSTQHYKVRIITPKSILTRSGSTYMGHIELCNHLLYLKPFNCMQTNK